MVNLRSRRRSSLGIKDFLLFGGPALRVRSGAGRTWRALIPPSVRVNVNRQGAFAGGAFRYNHRLWRLRGRFTMTRFILHALAAALGFWLASRIIPGVAAGGVGSLLAAGVVLGIINALVRPILILMTFPLTILTLGLFLLVVNGVTVWLATAFPLGVHIDGLWHAILAAVIIRLTSWRASALIGRSRPARLSR